MFEIYQKEEQELTLRHVDSFGVVARECRQVLTVAQFISKGAEIEVENNRFGVGTLNGRRVLFEEPGNPYDYVTERKVIDFSNNPELAPHILKADLVRIGDYIWCILPYETAAGQSYVIKMAVPTSETAMYRTEENLLVPYRIFTLE